MIGIFDELVRFMDDWAAKNAEAQNCKPTSKEAISAKAALNAYEDFKRVAARDFQVMMGCAAEDNRGALEHIVSLVSSRLADRLDFDAVSAQAHYCQLKYMELRHDYEQLRKDFEAMQTDLLKMQS